MLFYEDRAKNFHKNPSASASRSKSRLWIIISAMSQRAQFTAEYRASWPADAREPAAAQAQQPAADLRLEVAERPLVSAWLQPAAAAAWPPPLLVPAWAVPPA